MVAFSSTLTQARLQKRYKRFLADVILADGTEITVHCPNTGAMTGCCIPQSMVYLSKANNPKRKYAYTWEYASDEQNNKICINTNNANKVIKAALHKKQLSEVSQYSTIVPEKKFNKSRIDFMLQEDGLPDCYIEVKSATLAFGSTAFFPDTVTTRGQKHCYELAELSQQGCRAILLFCVMRQSITEFKIAHHIDPDYAKAVKFAVEQGVEVLCYGCTLALDGINISHSIPIIW